MPTVARHIQIDSIIAAYERHRNIWKAGNELGINGRTISIRLQEIGHPTNKNNVTPEEERIIVDYYLSHPGALLDTEELQKIVKRSRITISRVARKHGLTEPGRQTIKGHERSRASVQGMWGRHPHPKGMLGKKHTPELKEKMSERSKIMWATAKTFGIGVMSESNREKRRRRQSEAMANRSPANTYSSCRAGIRADIGEIYFRSSWEANYARYLNLLKKMGVVEWWDFEKEVFWFQNVKRGVTNYKPDFRVKYRNDDVLEYVEVKGWVRPSDKTKWKRMRKYHPHIKLIVVGQKEYESLKRKWKGAIPEWEGVHGGGRKLGPRKSIR